MKCTIHANEPNILRDARPGDLFIVRTAEEGECVCALLDAQLPPIMSHFRDEESMKRVVAVACRVDEGEPGWHPVGAMTMLSTHTPIQFLEQIEVGSFRERGAAAPDALKALTIAQQVEAIVQSFDHEAIQRAHVRKSHETFSCTAPESPTVSKPGDRM